VIRRHLDIGDNDIRAVDARHPDKVTGIHRGAHYLEAAVLQDVDDSFPDNRLILTDHHANLPRRAHGTNLRDPVAGAEGLRDVKSAEFRDSG
jgi:hypothetical protein